MADLAEKAGAINQVAFVMRYLPAVRQMKALVEGREDCEVPNFRGHMFHGSYLNQPANVLALEAVHRVAAFSRPGLSPGRSGDLYLGGLRRSPRLAPTSLSDLPPKGLISERWWMSTIGLSARLNSPAGHVG